MSEPWLSLLGMARRAGRLVSGTETVSAAVRRGQVTLIMAAADLSPKTKERLTRLAQAHQVRLLFGASRAELGAATGYAGRGVYGLTQKDLANAIGRYFGADGLVGTAEGGVHDSQQD
ncbi:MAG: 50S ribosomal protein L7 [Chloroflexi bacterium]|nr:MAG: 50S ribosomal protein L7 [Chloroflexota bacterium]